MKDILFLIEGKDKKKIKKVESRVKEIILNSDMLLASKMEIISIPYTDQQLYYKNPEVRNISFTPQFVCLLHEDMELSDNIYKLYSEYFNYQEEALYLPLVILENKKVKGVLNNCLWNSNLAMEVGYLDHDLSLRQMDTTLYGALIPYELFVNEEYYNTELSYYQHFHFLNKYTEKEKSMIIGIPKILYTVFIDLSFEGIETDAKVTNFKMARQMDVIKNNENNLKIV